MFRAAASPPAGESASPWDHHARQWHKIAAPLRPSADDLLPVQQLLDQCDHWQPPRRDLSVLMLGVTAELAALRFPARTRLLAVDSSIGMLQRQWQAPAGCAALRVHGRWESLPLRDASVDLVLADGSFCALPGVPAIEHVLARVAAAMRPGAMMAARMFTRPQPRETLAEVLQAVRSRAVGSVHVAKWRVAMALHGDLAEGVVLDEVWQAFSRIAQNLPQLALSTGWPLDSVETLLAYRGVAGRYYFPTGAETAHLFAAHFEPVAHHVPGYELGERCPTCVVRRR